MRQGTRAFRLLGLLPLLGGCLDFDPVIGPGTYDSPSSGCWFCVPFALLVERGTATMLKGDTVQVSIISTMGHDRGTFTVVGNALRLVDGNDLVTGITSPRTEARVVAIATGRDTVKSQAADTAASDRVALRVVDSSSVTSIQAGIELNPRLRAGETRLVDVFLWSGQEIIFGGPTSISVSNAAVLAAEPAQVNPKAVFLRAKAVGNSTLTLRFLDVSRTVNIEVIP